MEVKLDLRKCVIANHQYALHQRVFSLRFNHWQSLEPRVSRRHVLQAAQATQTTSLRQSRITLPWHRQSLESSNCRQSTQLGPVQLGLFGSSTWPDIRTLFRSGLPNISGGRVCQDGVTEVRAPACTGVAEEKWQRKGHTALLLIICRAVGTLTRGHTWRSMHKQIQMTFLMLGVKLSNLYVSLPRFCCMLPGARLPLPMLYG